MNYDFTPCRSLCDPGSPTAEALLSREKVGGTGIVMRGRPSQVTEIHSGMRGTVVRSLWRSGRMRGEVQRMKGGGRVIRGDGLMSTGDS